MSRILVKKRAHLFLQVLALCGFSPKVYAVMTPELFHEVRKISNEILSKCPPTEYALIGIGRSPTPLIAYLQLIHKNYAWNVPLSNFGYGIGEYEVEDSNEEEIDKGVEIPKLKKSEKTSLNQHFSVHAPTAEILQGRSVCIIDFSQTGRTIASAKKHLVEFFDSWNQSSDSSSIRVRAIPIAYEDSAEEIAISYSKYVEEPIALDEDNPLADAFSNRTFGPFSEYSRFDIKKDIMAFPNFESYSQLQNEIQAFIKTSQFPVGNKTHKKKAQEYLDDTSGTTSNKKLKTSIPTPTCLSGVSSDISTLEAVSILKSISHFSDQSVLDENSKTAEP